MLNGESDGNIMRLILILHYPYSILWFLKMNPKNLFLMPHLVGRLLQQMELVILVKAEHDSVT
jgi:hypothetical protein